MSFSFPALFVAGLLTFLSPCVLPLVPIYLATLAGTSATALCEGKRGKRLFLSTVLIQSLEVLAGQKCDGFRLLPSSPAEGS